MPQGGRKLFKLGFKHRDPSLLLGGMVGDAFILGKFQSRNLESLTLGRSKRALEQCLFSVRQGE